MSKLSWVVDTYPIPLGKVTHVGTKRSWLNVKAGTLLQIQPPKKENCIVSSINLNFVAWMILQFSCFRSSMHSFTHPLASAAGSFPARAAANGKSPQRRLIWRAVYCLYAGRLAASLLGKFGVWVAAQSDFRQLIWSNTGIISIDVNVYCVIIYNTCMPVPGLMTNEAPIV